MLAGGQGPVPGRASWMARPIVLLRCTDVAIAELPKEIELWQRSNLRISGRSIPDGTRAVGEVDARPSRTASSWYLWVRRAVASRRCCA